MNEHLISAFPSINFGSLRRDGVFSQIGVTFGYKAGDLRFLVWATNASQLEVWWEGLPEPVSIPIVKVKQTFGERGYFSCPQTQARCQKLILIDGIMASPAYHRAYLGAGGDATRWQAKVAHATARLLGGNGRGPARGAHRDRLLAVLPSGRDFVGSPEILALLNERITRRRRRSRGLPRSSRKKGPLSTAAALERGQSQEGVAVPPSWPTRRRAKPPLLPPPNRSNAFVEDHAVLDIGVLVTTLAVQPDGHAAVRLVWPEEVSCGAASFTVFIDLQSGRTPTVVVQATKESGRGMTTQVLDLVEPQPGLPPRWSLVCPMSGRRSDALFLRDGMFASAKAQRLIYRSQRQRAKRRTSSRTST